MDTKEAEAKLASDAASIDAALRGDSVKAQSFFEKHKGWVIPVLAFVAGFILRGFV